MRRAFAFRLATAAAVAVAVASCSDASAELGPPAALPAPSAELAEPFSMVAGAVELADGRVIVADGVEGSLSIVDLAAGTRTPLGRQGSGPGEFRAPAGIFQIHGDTVWVLDAAQQRMVTFNPDLTPGTTFAFSMLDQSTMTQLTAPLQTDRNGMFYASAMAIRPGAGGVEVPDSVGVVRVDPRATDKPTELTRTRFPTSGSPQMRVEGNVVYYTVAYPGLVSADAWAVFPDGRVAIVRGGPYTVEFIAADGTRSAPIAIPYDHIVVTEADKTAEMDEVRRQTQEQTRMAQRMMPANMRIELNITPPVEWPAEYPAVSPLGVLAGPDGRLWVKRATPVRIKRERWDVIDASGKLVGKWILPEDITLVAVGAKDVVYTVRRDDDDLRYLRRVELGR